ncbi:site-2 protease family protein [Legionella hackeliae]|uniref:SpoIVFB, Zn-dependent protease n=1 Tax=Legionella hackeliae TaxID=449 RepID=A0A0A8UUN3_LEGHA|nr:site-2 protease family protein [Legionella hackeliae]KTD15419.1 transmembrane protein [Legionella hackeliae]CEK11211.1 SpoIVFB, Zn-dependent protease [Legionella hackeliae]STX47977.1 transmembrane protein [Legionella hackeliae]
MLELTTVQQIAIWILPVLFAITLHEASHAWVAYRLGDTTAKMLGRLSFNPIRHIDLIGTIIVPIVVLIVSQFNFVFGWAKPVPINDSQFRHPRRDVALSTAAGPLSNLLMAILWAGLLKLAINLNPQSSNAALFLLLASRAGVIINLLLAYLNLIPIPPLDGSRILASLLPPRQAYVYQKIEPWGFFILLLLMFTGILSWLINPPIQWSLMLLRSLFNL